MALYVRLGHRLTRTGLKHVLSGSGTKPTFGGLLIKRKGHDWDTRIPDGYEHIFLPKKDLPDFIPEGELTPEKRAELAAKYNLRPEDYKPLANAGDYPEMPEESASDRDPYYDWDCTNLRRNHGEPLHYETEKYDRLSPLDRKPLMVDFNQILKVLVTLTGTIAVLTYIGEFFPRFRPLAPKQYPEWYPIDDKFTGNTRGPMWKEMGRRTDVHYAFPPSPNDGLHH